MGYSSVSKEELNNLKEFVKRYEESSDKEKEKFIKELAEQVKREESKF